MCPIYRRHRTPQRPPARVRYPDRHWGRSMHELPTDQWDFVRKTLDHQRRLKETLKAVAQLSSQAAQGQVQAMLEGTQEDLDGLDEFFSTYLHQNLYNEHISVDLDKDTPASQQVFEVPELLELILSSLSIADVMSFQQVNCNARDAIEGSPRLQRKLSLREEATSGTFRAPFGGEPFPAYTPGIPGGFWCGYKSGGCICITGDQLNIAASFAQLDKGLPKIGGRWRRMFVCQPPVKKMSISIPCCYGKNSPKTEHHIESEKGLTIGDLYDKTKQLVTEHRLCPKAPASHHNLSDGIVMINPRFSATVKLEPDDPIFKAEERRRERPPPLPPNESEQAALRAPQERIRAYIDYKRRAHESGEEIKTLRDLEATGWYWSPLQSDLDSITCGNAPPGQLFWDQGDVLDSFDFDSFLDHSPAFPTIPPPLPPLDVWFNSDTDDSL